ncbi:MAG: metallophosphoesterase [Candidatus Abyssobacteria bacterium SURF_5]|uniref:Phosphoesterase n=1 Tax=Abyssobacteria bacterium (strain SURF_5) TaxID=2093360 RepID=A0A3A4NMI0_ABYX5|nr:MAG: metallophosphoesterase [Candidatus Abyssubacteria bacterium SURF_5]
MLVGILSDTHDNMIMLKKAVDCFLGRGVDLVLHAGDYVAPFTARELGRLNCGLIGVFGNNDGDKLLLTKKYEGIGQLYDGIHQLKVDGKMIALTHYPDIAETLASRGAYDVVICGHNHRAKIVEGKTLLINPGECCGWLEGTSTIAFLDLLTMRTELVTL